MIGASRFKRDAGLGARNNFGRRYGMILILRGPRSRSTMNCSIKPMKREGRSAWFSFSRWGSSRMTRKRVTLALNDVPEEFQGFHNVIELGCPSTCGIGRRHSPWRIRMRYAERKGKMVGMYVPQNLSEFVLSAARPIRVGLVAAIDGHVRCQP